MIRYEKKFGVTGKEVDLNEEQSKKVATLVFTILGCIFMILGGIGVATARSPDDYAKNGEHHFTYVQINRDTRTSRTRVNGRTKTTTNTYYIPMYVGDVEGESYTYNYYKEFSSEEQAMAFVTQNETILVTSYLNENNQLYFLASDRSLEEHFKWEKIFGAIGVVAGAFFTLVGVSVGTGWIPMKKRKETLGA